MNSTSSHFDLIVVGSGILGTFHAYHALRQQKKVLLLEKDNYPVGASVRNFGQIVPSGMAGEWFGYGIKGLKVYKSIQQEADISVRNNGSVYIASDEDEQRLLHEVKKRFDDKMYPCRLLSREQTLARYPAVRADYVKEGLFFPEEISVEPETMLYKLIAYMRQKFPKLTFYANTAVTGCDINSSHVTVSAAGGKRFSAEKTIICSGGEFRLLFPEIFAQSGIVISKLQMMRTFPMPEVGLEGNILTGLSIRRYESFAECPSFTEITVPGHYEELKKWGIHILFKKASDGSIIIGDSHEYADALHSDDLGFHLDQHINDLMLHEAQRIADFDISRVASKWAGFYPQHNEKDIFEYDIEDRVHIRTAIGGKGMTASAGYAENVIGKLFQANQEA